MRRDHDVLRRSASADASVRFGGFERGGAQRVADSAQGDDGIGDVEMGGVAELLFVGLRDVDQLVLAGRRGRKDRGEELALVHEQNADQASTCVAPPRMKPSAQSRTITRCAAPRPQPG